MPQINASSIATPISARMVAIQPNATGGWDVTWADGNTNFYGSREEIYEKLNELFTPDLVKLLDLASWFARDPDGSNPNIILNKTLTIDLTAVQPWKMQ